MAGAVLDVQKKDLPHGLKLQLRRVCFASSRRESQNNLKWAQDLEMILHARYGLAVATAVLLFPFPMLLRAQRNALLPEPQKVQYGAGSLRLERASIEIAGNVAAEDQFAAETLAAGLRRLTGQDVSLAPIKS